MATIKILTEPELRSLVTLDAATIECIEDCFRALATEAVVMPPILHLEIAEANGEIDTKTAYVPGLDSLAMKMSCGFFDNPKQGLPSLGGLMVVLSARTGVVEALLLDNGYLTDIRTAAAGAVAAKWLARKDSRRAGVLGTGGQARLQLEALCQVRPIEAASIWGRDHEKAEALADEMTNALGIAITATEDLERLVSTSDVVVSTTPSRVPLIEAKWLHPGLHITAMGSDAAYKNEVEPSAIAAADLYVPDRLSQVEILGELHHAVEAGVVAAGSSFPELGHVVAGRHRGRGSEDAMTICDLTGTGVQDTAIATLARSRADSMGVGAAFET